MSSPAGDGGGTTEKKSWMQIAKEKKERLLAERQARLEAKEKERAPSRQATPQKHLDSEFDIAQQQAEMLRAVVGPMEEEMADLRAQLKAARAGGGGDGTGSGFDPADKEHIEKLEQRISQMGAEAEAEQAALEVKLEEATKRADAAVARAEATEASLEAALRAGDDRASAASDDAAALRDELMRLASEVEQAHAEATQAGEKLTLAEKSHDEHVVAAQAAADALRTRCKEAEAAASAKSVQITELTTQLMSRPHQQEVDALKAELKALKVARNRGLAEASDDGAAVEEGGAADTPSTATNDDEFVRDTETPEASRRAIASLECRLEDMQLVLTTKTAEHTETMERLTAERDRLDALEADVQSERKLRKKAEQDLMHLTKELESSRSDAAALQTRAGMATQERDNLSSELQTLRDALVAAQTTATDARAQLESASEERAKREADAVVAKQLADGLHTEVASLKTKLAARVSEAERATRDAEQAKEKLETLRQTHNAFKEEHADMRVRCEAAATGAAEAKEAAEELASLRSAHESKSTELKGLQESLQEYKALLEGVETERSELRTQVKDQGRWVQVKTKVKAQEDATATLEAAVQAANDKLKALKEKHAEAIAAKAAEIEALKGEVQSKAGELEAIGLDLAVIVESAKKNKEKLGRKETELTTLRSQLEEKEKALADAGKTADTRQGDLEAVGQDLAELAQKLSTSEAQVATLKAELEARGDKSKDDVTALETKMAELEARCTELDSANAVLVRDCKAATVKATQSEANAKKVNLLVAELEEDKLALENEMGDLAKKNREMSKDSKMLNQMIQQTKELFVKQKVALQAEVTRAQVDCKTAQEQLAGVVAERDALKTRIQAEVAGLRGKVEKAEQAREATVRKLELTKTHYEGEVKSMETALAAAKESLSAQTGDKAVLSERIDSLEAERSSLQENLRDGMQAFQKLQGEHKAAQKKLATLAGRFNSLNQDLKDRTAALQELGEENAELRKEVAEISTRTWQRNNEVKACPTCPTKFSATNRKHHCRSCGQIFCDKCSSKKTKTTTSKKPVRVCNKCFTELA